jgi:hypothetical protein
MAQLTQEPLKDYENKWVAFAAPDQQEIVGSGNTLAEAKREARQKGFSKPIFFKVLPDAYYIPTL